MDLRLWFVARGTGYTGECENLSINAQRQQDDTLFYVDGSCGPSFHVVCLPYLIHLQTSCFNWFFSFSSGRKIWLFRSNPWCALMVHMPLHYVAARSEVSPPSCSSCAMLIVFNSGRNEACTTGAWMPPSRFRFNSLFSALPWVPDATPLRKSAPWPPNICDEHVLCAAPAMECIFESSLQVLFKTLTPAIIL